MSNHVADFNTRNQNFNSETSQTRLSVSQTPPNVFKILSTMTSKFNTGLKSLLKQGLSEREFYSDLVHKFKKIVGRNDFFGSIRKIIIRYKRIGYNMSVMLQTACLVVNPITVNNFADLFNCTPEVRASDLMIAPA